MSNKDLASYLVIGAIGAVVVLVPQDLDMLNRVIVASAIIGVCIIFWFMLKDKDNRGKTINPNVSLHYPCTHVTDDNYHKLNPEYITNNKTYQAYKLSKELTDYCVRRRGIDTFVPYKSVSELKRQLQIDYTINERKATFEDLDIILKGDDTLMIVPNPVSDNEMALLHDCEAKGDFKDLELVFLFSFHNFTKRSRAHYFLTNRRILIDHKKRIARPTPFGDLWMWKAGIFKEKQTRKLLPCTIGLWCFFYGLRKHHKPIWYHKNERCDIKELLTEASSARGLSKWQGQNGADKGGC